MVLEVLPSASIITYSDFMVSRRRTERSYFFPEIKEGKGACDSELLLCYSTYLAKSYTILQKAFDGLTTLTSSQIPETTNTWKSQS